MLKLLAWWERVKYLWKEEKGQGMVEYGLIIALIAVAVIAAITLLGTNLSSMFQGIAGKITTP